MTQMLHWFAAFALFLASNAGVVRVEEVHEEVASPVSATAERLPAAPLVQAAACCKTCGSSCACCSKCCAQTKETEPTQYVVTTKFVDASPDGDCDETMSPRLTVLEGQTANVVVNGEETPTQRRAVGLQVRLTKQDARLHLDLGVENHMEWNHTAVGQPSMMTSACRMGCNVTLGKTKRLVLTKHATNGSDASWVEVTVTEIAPDMDEDESPLDYATGVVEELIDAVAEVATTLFGDDDGEVKQAVYAAPTADAPLTFPVQAVAPCATCKQCVAVEAAKKPFVRLHTDAENDRMIVEMGVGSMCWKASAKQITVVHGRLELEGDVTVECDCSPFMAAEKMSVQLPDGAAIPIGD